MKKVFLSLVLLGISCLGFAQKKTITLYGQPANFYGDGSIECGRKSGKCAEIVVGENGDILSGKFNDTVLKVYVNPILPIILQIKSNYTISNRSGRTTLFYEESFEN